MTIKTMLLAFLCLCCASTAHADPLRIVIAGDGRDAISQSFADAVETLSAGPEQARYLELSVPTEALQFMTGNGHALKPAFCSSEEGKGERRIRGIHRLGVEGVTTSFVRYRIQFDLDSVAAARPWTDLACQYRDAKNALVLRGHFVAKDLGIIEGLDVDLTAVAP